MSLLKDLEDRGFLEQCSSRELLERELKETALRFYCGFDPTSPSLHCGNLVPLFAMKKLSEAGHRPIALMGGGTVRVGDPSGRTEARKLMESEEINRNIARIEKQVRFILKSDSDGSAEDSSDSFLLLNNADWLLPLNYVDFLREIGRHFSVNRMLGFEAYKQRMERGLSFLEFNYQLLQAYDYLHLFREHDCRLQIGGNDQWGNMVAGMDLIRRVTRGDSHVLTFPLLLKADGSKMGKSLSGAVYLDPSLTPVYDFYQYWRNIDDRDLEKCLLLFTDIPSEDCRSWGRKKGPVLNEAKEQLAWQLTRTIHGRDEADKVQAGARSVFGASGTGTAGGEIPRAKVPLSDLEAGLPVLEVLCARTGLCSSKSEARRLIEQGGFSLNGEKITGIDYTLGSKDLQEPEAETESPFLLLKAGKKRFFRLDIDIDIDIDID